MTVPEAPASALDPAALGEALIRLPMVAATLRHASLQSALGYLHADDEPVEFIRALLTRPLSEVLDDWYGGRDHADRLAATIIAAEIAQHRAPSVAGTV